MSGVRRGLGLLGSPSVCRGCWAHPVYAGVAGVATSFLAGYLGLLDIWRLDKQGVTNTMSAQLTGQLCRYCAMHLDGSKMDRYGQTRYFRDYCSGKVAYDKIPKRISLFLLFSK